jgi:hypothetical protein
MTILKGNCQTTAMGILPHTDIDAAIKLALTMDIPFWPQLPRVSFNEDMYVQITENFPGIAIDPVEYRINFDLDNFYQDLGTYVENIDNEEFFRLTGDYSVVYHRFLQQPHLEKYNNIRGQSIGPVSFGMKILDKDKKPIIYNDEVKGIIYDIMAKKFNVQYRELKALNDNAFVWLDEPGLNIIFGSFTGYSSETAKKDYREFLNNLEGPKGIHLCGNPDWTFLLKDVQLDILSMDIFSNGKIFIKYVEEIKAFLERGGIISWGIIPTLKEEVDGETINSLFKMMDEYWSYLEQHGISKALILERAWLAPSRCCLVNADGEKTVEGSFKVLSEIAGRFKEKYSLV